MWDRLLGCFGDSLIRKFGEEPPPEWAVGIGMLNDYQLAQGMRRLVLSGKAHAPTLPEFMKLCRSIGHADDIPDETPRLALPVPEDGFDAWATLANRRLLRYITTVIPANTKRYGPIPSEEAMNDPARKHLANADASPEFIRNVHTLVALKNQWADLMRASADQDGVPIDEQDAAWDQGMRQAEEIIASERAEAH